MSDERDRNGKLPPDDEDPDTGEPIAVLSALGRLPAPGFVRGVLLKLERRSLGGQVAVLAWHLPRAVVFEFLQMVFELFLPADGGKGGER